MRLLTLLALKEVPHLVSASRFGDDTPFLPYPQSELPLGIDGPLFAVATNGLDSCDVVTAQALSGVLARHTPKVYTVDSSLEPSSSDAAFWLQELVKQEVIAGVNDTFLDDLGGLLGEFAAQLDGYVAYSDLSGTNAAVTMASDTPGSVIVACRPETKALLDSLGVVLMTTTAITAVALNARAAHLTPKRSSVNTSTSPLLSKRMAVFAPSDGSKSQCLTGYALFGRMAMVEYSGVDHEDGGGSDAATAAWEEVLGALGPLTLNAGTGWFTGGDEFEYVSELAVRGGAWAHASDWSTNLETYANMRQTTRIKSSSSSSSAIKAMAKAAVKAAADKKALRPVETTIQEDEEEKVAVENTPAAAADATTTATAAATASTSLEAVHTVSFVLSDGDNACWLQGGWRSEAWYGAPERGQAGGSSSVPLGWTFAPAAATDLLPVVYAYAMANATADDSFVAGPSGAGYTYPKTFFKGVTTAPVNAAASSTATPTTNSLDETTQSVSSSSSSLNRSQVFSSVTAQMMAASGMTLLNVIGEAPSLESVVPLAAHEEVSGVLLYTYGDGYSGLRGNVAYVNDKPVVGGRLSLWGEELSGDMVGVQGLVNALKSLPKDPSDPNSYSLIPVHAWSHNCSSVVAAVRALEAGGGFSVVLPEVFFAKLVAQTSSREQCPLPSGPWSNGCVDCVLSGNGTCVLSCGNCLNATTTTTAADTRPSSPPPPAAPAGVGGVKPLGGVAASCDLSYCHSGLYLDLVESFFRCSDGTPCAAGLQRFFRTILSRLWAGQ